MQTENTDSYNGWTNYETWLVNLWLVNTNQGTYAIAREMAAEGADALRDWVKDWATGFIPAPTLAADLLGAALSKVNWREITESLLAE